MDEEVDVLMDSIIKDFLQIQNTLYKEARSDIKNGDIAFSSK